MKQVVIFAVTFWQTRFPVFYCSFYNSFYTVHNDITQQHHFLFMCPHVILHTQNQSLKTRFLRVQETFLTSCSCPSESSAQAFPWFGLKLFKPRCADLQINHNNLLYCHGAHCTGWRQQPRSIIFIKQSHCISGGRAVSSSTLPVIVSNMPLWLLYDFFSFLQKMKVERREVKGGEGKSSWDDSAALTLHWPLSPPQAEKLGRSEGSRWRRRWENNKKNKAEEIFRCNCCTHTGHHVGKDRKRGEEGGSRWMDEEEDGVVRCDVHWPELSG